MSEIRVTVPGKIMLAGEYSVLKGEAALAITIDRYLNARISTNSTSEFVVTSNLWASPRICSPTRTEYDGDLLLDAVIQAARRYQQTGGTVVIESQLDIRHGLGSSSALRLAVFAGLHCAQLRQKGQPWTSAELWQAAEAALHHQRQNQSKASGYDIVTQATGGLVLWQMVPPWPGSIQSLTVQEDAASQIFFMVGGQGAPTTKTIASGSSWLDADPSRWSMLIALTRPLTEAFMAHFQNPSAATIAHLVAATAHHRQFWQMAPHFPAGIRDLLAQIPGLDQTWSWKPTGAGGEDALILVGPPQKLSPVFEVLQTQGWEALSYRIVQDGLSLMEQIR